MLKKSDVFSEKKLEMPFRYDSVHGFKEGTVNWIEEYIALLKKYNFDNCIIDKVSAFKLHYENMLELYYQGKHEAAYLKFKDSIYNLLGDNIGLLLQRVTESEFYRARIVPENRKDICYEEKDIWHIPYEKRGVVKTERYSFPGLPCLYLGASSYACWIEMNRPQYNTIQVAYVKPKEKIFDSYFLDISLLPVRYHKLVECNENTYGVDEYALICPIIAMCMVKVLNEDHYFKPEYIFTQFFMEYILDDWSANDIIGIKYASTKSPSMIQYRKDYCELYTCYVIPAVSTDDIENNQDETKDYFYMEKTIAAVEQELLSYGLANEKGGLIDKARAEYMDKNIYTESDMAVSYDSTRFFEIEFSLRIKEYLE